MATNTGIEKKERNIELYKDFKSGKFNVVELVSKYRITSQAIYGVVKRMDSKMATK